MRLIQSARPKSEDGGSPHRVRIVAMGDHARNKGVHSHLLEAYAGQPLQGVQSARHIGVEETVFELILDPGSFAAVENAVAVFRRQEQWSRNGKTGPGTVELIDSTDHLLGGTREWKETEHGAPP